MPRGFPLRHPIGDPEAGGRFHFQSFFPGAPLLAIVPIKPVARFNADASSVGTTLAGSMFDTRTFTECLMHTIRLEAGTTASVTVVVYETLTDPVVNVSQARLAYTFAAADYDFPHTIQFNPPLRLGAGIGMLVTASDWTVSCEYSLV